MAWTRGSHSLRFGASIDRVQSATLWPFQGESSWTFGSVPLFLAGTARAVTGVTTAPSNYPIRDFREIDFVYMDRMDGQGYQNIYSAEMKARTALTLREPTKILLDDTIKQPELALRYNQLGEFANSGGLPIVVNQQLIGAVGVGGSGLRPPVWGDEICAHEALVQVFGPSVPPLVDDLPQPQNANAGRAQGLALRHGHTAEICFAGRVGRQRKERGENF